MSAEVCKVCTKKVYATEKLVADNLVFHKSCFRCKQCNGVLKLGSYASMGGETFCKPCFKKNFFTKGNYSEGFGKLKPQHEHDLKTGKRDQDGDSEKGTDAFDEEKKRQEEQKKQEEEQRKQARKKQEEEEKEKKRAAVLEGEREHDVNRSESFKARQSAFLKDDSAEQEEKRREKREKLFEETRQKREQSLKAQQDTERGPDNSSPSQEKINKDRDSIRATFASSRSAFLDKQKEASSNSPKDRPSKEDQPKASPKEEQPKRPATMRHTARETSSPTLRDNTFVSPNKELEDANKKIASLQSELEQAREEIKALQKELSEARATKNDNDRSPKESPKQEEKEREESTNDDEKKDEEVSA